MTRNSAHVTIRWRSDGSIVDANRHRNWIKFQCKSTIYTVRPDGTDNFKVNGPLVLDGNTGGPQWSPDGSRIVYGADQDTDSVSEIYLSTPDGVININISGLLVPGGDALEFAWAP